MKKRTMKQRTMKQRVLVVNVCETRDEFNENNYHLVYYISYYCLIGHSKTNRPY